jgi:hypothetical protein
MAFDPAYLIEQAKCFKCIPTGMQPEVMLYLLSKILEREVTILNSGEFGFLSAFGAGPFITLVGPAPTAYAQVVNYTSSLFGGAVTVNAANGTITIAKSGYYLVSFSVSSTPGNNQQVEGDIAVNGNPDDLIAAHCSGPLTSREQCMASSGVLLLNAGDTVSIMCRNLDGTTMDIDHAQLTVGTPA